MNGEVGTVSCAEGKQSLAPEEVPAAPNETSPLLLTKAEV